VATHEDVIAAGEADDDGSGAPSDYSPPPLELTLAYKVSKLNAEQRIIYDYIAAGIEAFAAWFRGGRIGPRPPPLHVFIHGGPGCGKSYLAKIIR